MGSSFKPDWVAALIVTLLIGTLLAFFAGVFPYPYGVLVLAALLVFRLTAIQKKD